MRGALNKHIRVHHTCQHCGAVGKGKPHEEACLRKQERKQERKTKYVEAIKRRKELKVAREAMLLICLADKEDKETNQTPIATLTADVLQCVFKHI